MTITALLPFKTNNDGSPFRLDLKPRTNAGIIVDPSHLPSASSQLAPDVPLSPATQLSRLVEGRPFVRDVSLNEARLEPSRLTQHIDLFIEVLDGGRKLRLYRVPADTLPNTPPLNANGLELITEVDSHGLLYPDVPLARTLDYDQASRVISLYGRGRRYTHYEGVTVDWDLGVDHGVWTTNIDTVVFMRELKKLGLLNAPDIKDVVEVGVGGGHLSCFVAHTSPFVERLTFTDILVPALRCALRNLNYYRRETLDTVAYLGKGIKALPGGHDLLLNNPPYIPVLPSIAGDHRDPYRGTGLIREVVQSAPEKARRVLIHTSSMSLMDLEKYAHEFDREIIIHAESEWIPLKIEHVTPQWVEWLVGNGGLQYRDPAQHYYPYWHQLFCVEIRKK